MNRELILLTFEGWGVLTAFDVNEALDRARDNPGLVQCLVISDDWFADVVYDNGNYILTQGRTTS